MRHLVCSGLIVVVGGFLSVFGIAFAEDDPPEFQGGECFAFDPVFIQPDARRELPALLGGAVSQTLGMFELKSLPAHLDFDLNIEPSIPTHGETTHKAGCQ